MKTVTIFALALLVSCTQGQAKTAVDIGIQVSEDLCAEEATQPAEPDWVKIACVGVTAGAPLVHVLMPREEWGVIKGRKIKHSDAGAKPINLGPGK